MAFEICGEIWYWKGPAPWYFITVPSNESREIKAIEKMATYGWGMIPVEVKIGKTKYKTALWPKDGAYIVPVKASVRKAERLNEGDEISARLEVITIGR